MGTVTAAVVARRRVRSASILCTGGERARYAHRNLVGRCALLVVSSAGTQARRRNTHRMDVPFAHLAQDVQSRAQLM